MRNRNLRTLVRQSATIVFGFCATPAAAQVNFETYGVSDWKSLIPVKRVEFQTYRTIVLGNGSLSDNEKAKRISEKFAEVEATVREARLKAYNAVTRKIGIGNSATKGNSGGDPKESGPKCRGADLPEMYTKPEWAQGAYKSGGDPAGPNLLQSGNRVDPATIVDKSGSEVCAIYLKQSGKGRKASYSEATFHIRPSQVKALVDIEMTPIMNEISKSPL